jgi:hypothetical protein
MLTKAYHWVLFWAVQSNLPPEYLHSFIHSSVVLQPMVGPWHFLQFHNFFTLSVVFLRRVNSPSQGCYLHTGQRKYRINAYKGIHALSGIRTHDPRVWADEDSSCLHCDRPQNIYFFKFPILFLTIGQWHAILFSRTYYWEFYLLGYNAL